MPQTPKEKPKLENCEDKETDKDSWGEDQKEHGYYYDDAYGYEEYDPDKSEGDED
jgi:hypothetical protein